MSRQLIKKAADIFNQKDIPVLQRLTMMMMALNVDGNLGQEVMDQVHKPQNALLHQKMQIGLLTGINPLITSLIDLPDRLSSGGGGNDAVVFQRRIR